MEQMLIEQRRSTEAIMLLVETIKSQREFIPVTSLGKGLGNDFPTISQTGLAQKSEKVAVAAPSKMELATNWLKGHPDDVSLTGRELETARLPMGVKISYKTWNDAKKQLT